MLIVDAHLDLSYNALRGREVLKPAREQMDDGDGIPTCGLPDLRAGNVGLCCATVFCRPAGGTKPGYRNAEEAAFMAETHLAWYRAQESAGQIRFVHKSADLPSRDTKMTATSALSAIMLLEGADALRTPDDLPKWYDVGLRIVGLAWGRTRFAGGTDAPGPLTPEGIELIPHLDQFKLIHDLSHLDDASFWGLLEQTNGPVIASHSNCRAFVPTNRQLSDEMIRAIIERDGVIGINFYDQFLLPPDEYGKRRATLKDVIRHMDRICDIAGSANHVAIGTDMDGGLGRNEVPEEIVTSEDLPKLATALRAAGYGEPAIDGIMGANWLRQFGRDLPSR